MDALWDEASAEESGRDADDDCRISEEEIPAEEEPPDEDSGLAVSAEDDETPPAELPNQADSEDRASPEEAPADEDSGKSSGPEELSEQAASHTAQEKSKSHFFIG